MKKDHCENVPENGYGYGKHKYTKNENAAKEDKIASCPKFDCSQCNNELRKNNTKFSWLSLSDLNQ